MSVLPDVVCRPIGIVHGVHRRPEGTPIQSAAAPDEAGEIEVFEPYAAGLRDLAGFGHVILLTHFHLCRDERLEVLPFLDELPRGVFATRAPTRPNRLGLSIVRLLRIDGRRLHIAGNDMVDGTPVLDIKPYVPAFDARDGAAGWFDGRLDALPGRLADDRMAEGEQQKRPDPRMLLSSGRRRGT